MKQVLINFGQITQKTHKEETKDLFWYDNIKKEMCRFKGGQLRFEYKKDDYLEKLGYSNNYRLLPIVDNLKVKTDKKISNKNNLKKWLEMYLDRNNTEISIIEEDNSGITVNVPDEEFDDFSYGLERANFNYELA